MKKLICCFLTVILMLALVGCGGKCTSIQLNAETITMANPGETRGLKQNTCGLHR